MTAQRRATLASLSATVFLGGCLIGLTALPVTAANIQATSIEDRGSLHDNESVAADLDTPVPGPESMVLSTAPTHAATNDLASPPPVDPVAEAANPEASSAPVAPAALSIGRAASAETPVALAGVPAAETGAPLSAAPPLLTSDPMRQDQRPASPILEGAGECPAPEVCIDEYLWTLYERAPKIDTNKVVERIRIQARVTIKKKNKSRIVTKTTVKTITKHVVGDFTWKDPRAAQRAGMALKDYVIGGMDPGFKLKLYRAARAMEDAGHMPAITSAFRDDYRQSIASGTKAASDSSYHGGSRRGGYGYGLAADLVSIKGDTRLQRFAASQELWKWIDAHEAELGIGRPYLDRDPPHVGPLNGAEYAAKRGRVIAQKAATQTVNLARLTKGAKLAQLKVDRPQPRSKTRERASKSDKLQAKDHLAKRDARNLVKRPKLAKSAAVGSVRSVPRKG